MTQIRFAIPLASLAIALSACVDFWDDLDDIELDFNENHKMERIVVRAPTTTLTSIGETVQLTATAYDENDDSLDDVEFEWSTSDKQVAKVDGNGLATAVGDGIATIKAKANDKTGKLQLEVAQVPASLAISPEAWSGAWVGARMQFTASADDANGHPISEPAVAWQSSDETRVRVDASGLATAYREGGDPDPEIAASAAGQSDAAPVDVPDSGSDPLALPRATGVPLDEAAPSGPAWPHPTVHAFQWEGDRIGLLTDVANGLGTFRARERAGEWVDLEVGNARDFQIESNRFAVLLEGGRLLVREQLAGPWVVQAESGVEKFQLSGDRVAFLSDGGVLRAKDGLAGSFTTLASGDIVDFQLEAGRIGVLFGNGSLHVKDGLGAPWTVLASSVGIAFRLHGNRIALLHEDGSLRARDGIDGSWTTLTSGPIRQFALEGDRIGVLFESGMLQVRSGIHGAWQVLETRGVREFQLQGDRVGWLGDDNALYVQTGVDGSVASTAAFDGSITQFQLCEHYDFAALWVPESSGSIDACLAMVDLDDMDDSFSLTGSCDLAELVAATASKN